MFKFLGILLNIFDTVMNFFTRLSDIIDPEYILYGAVGLLLLTILIVLAINSGTYEMKALQFVRKTNRYFKRNPQINEDNLIYVNNTFKRAPKNIRYAWQQYMLNRDRVPSDYINTNVCLDQPLKSSASDNTAKVLHITSIIIAILSFIANLSYMHRQENAGMTLTLADGQSYLGKSLGWAIVFLIPLLVYIVGAVVVIILRARHTAVVGDLYTEFHDFERYINRACSTMPSYIDYEVLFTRKEIRDGIPALQEYLEKRALEEQKEREEAELNTLPFEEFNFEALGLENSLLMERALKESEKFFNVKRNMSEKINAKTTEMASYQKNFDEVTKEFEKKAQAFRENLKQLNEQLNNTSVNIEANYIKKRYREDQQKLQQLEKDYEIATIRFNKQQNEINTEIEAYKRTEQDAHDQLERAMIEEGKTYANKIYGLINAKVVEQNKPYFDEQVQEIENMKKQIEELNAEIQDKENSINDLNFEKDKLSSELDTQKHEIEAIKNVREYLTSPEFRAVVIDRKKARQDSGIDGMSIEELRDKAATADEQLRIASEKEQAFKQTQDELMKKLKKLEENEKELLKQNEKLSMTKELQPVNQTIKQETTTLKENEEDLMGKINKTLENLDEDQKVKKQETKKKNLNNLMANVNKLKNKK